MKYKFLLGALMMGCSFSAMADGYTDGIDYYNAGQFANARTILDRTINDPSTDKALANYYLGQIEILYKDYAKAKQFFQAGIQANPANPYNYVGMGAYSLHTGNVKEAEGYFKEAQKLAKKNHEIPVEIARAYYTWKPEDAENLKTVRKYIDKARKDSKLQEPSIYMLEGDMFFDMGDHLGDAASQYELAIRYDQDDPACYAKYSRAYMGVNPEYGIQKMEEFLQRHPNSALAQRELAERYYETNQWHKAVKQYGEYINNPNHFPEDKARYSFLLWVYKDYQKAIEVCNEILATDPNNFQALRIKMLAQADMKDYAGAEQTALKFFANPGANNNFTQNDYVTYAEVLKGLGRPQDAVAQYEAALAINPDNVDALMNLAMGYSDADRNQEAAEYYQKAIEKSENPSLTMYLRASGMWLYAAGSAETDEVKIADANAGLADIDKVIADAGAKPDYLRRRAQLLYYRELGEVTPDLAAAYEQLVAALDEDPANMDPANNKLKWYQEAYRMLNKFYDTTGQTDKQEAVFEKFSIISNLLNPQPEN